jgi:serine/threonine-protein kinase HipA
VLWAETGEAGTYEFFRRLVFSVLIGNGDMHLKNWSLLYPDRRTPVLSPAYDFVATFPYIPNDSLALSFGGSRSLSEIGTDQVRRFADTARLPSVDDRHRHHRSHRCRMGTASRERPAVGEDA